MKLKLVLGFILSFVATVGFTQKEIIVGSQEYQSAKELGTLGEYNLVHNLSSFQPLQNNGINPKPTSNGTEKSGNCDCYQEPDATYTLAMGPNDDGSSGLIAIPFTFNFYGQNYTNFYINNNGNITFVNPLAAFSATAFPSAGNQIIAPFWGDVDTRNGNGQVLYKITPTAIYINWEDVGYYNTQGDKRNTFQLIISNGADASVPDGNNVAFCYQDMQWTTGSASQGVNGFGGIPATCGANKGDNIAYFLIARFDHAGNDFDGALGNPDGISWLDYKSFFFDVTNSGNVPPIPEGVSACDTFKICSFGDTADISINFFAPEANQLTSITYTNGGLTSLQEIANIPGNTAQLVLRVIGNPADAGTYDLTVTATDDFAPTPGVTTMSFVIVIEDDPNFTLDPILDYTVACDSFEVAVLNGPYDSYLWDNLSNDPSTYITETGEFGVTVRLGNCYKKVSEYIHVPEPAVFDLTGNLYLCPSEDSTLITIGNAAGIDIMDWNLNNPALDGLFQNWLTAGTYTISNTDSTGLCQNDTTFTIVQAQSSVLTGDMVSCFGLNYQTAGNFAGTSAVWSSPDPEISFSNPTVSNPIITASAHGIYTVVLTSPCENPLIATIVFPFAPTIFDDTLICEFEFDIPLSQVNTFGAATWSLFDPSIGTFAPSNAESATSVTFNYEGNFIVTLTDNLCPNLSDNAEIIVRTPPTVNIPTIACDMNAYGITSNFGQTSTILWTILDNPTTPFLEDTAASFVNGTTNSSQNPDIQVNNHGTYTLTYNIVGECPLSGSEEIYFPPYLFTDVADTNLCTGIEYPLNAYQGPYPATYSWNTGQVGPVINVTGPGTYIVTVSNECHSYSDAAVIDYYLCDIQAPNIISLSSTSGNNFWFVNADGISDFECFIVNRWGNLIYEYNDVNSGWNGQDRSGNLVEEGVYFYHIKAKSYGGQELEKQGFITVVH